MHNVVFIKYNLKGIVQLYFLPLIFLGTGSALTSYLLSEGFTDLASKLRRCFLLTPCYCLWWRVVLFQRLPGFPLWDWMEQNGIFCCLDGGWRLDFVISWNETKYLSCSSINCLASHMKYCIAPIVVWTLGLVVSWNLYCCCLLWSAVIKWYFLGPQ
jgi:hypothetical protein